MSRAMVFPVISSMMGVRLPAGKVIDVMRVKRGIRRVLFGGFQSAQLRASFNLLSRKCIRFVSCASAS